MSNSLSSSEGQPSQQHQQQPILPQQQQKPPPREPNPEADLQVQQPQVSARRKRLRFLLDLAFEEGPGVPTFLPHAPPAEHPAPAEDSHNGSGLAGVHHGPMQLPRGILRSPVIHPRLYEGRLGDGGCHVIVPDPKAGQLLHSHGFFGKGQLSRSRPQFDFPQEPWRQELALEDRREELQLDPVEAMWLVQALGCLRVFNASDENNHSVEGRQRTESDKGGENLGGAAEETDAMVDEGEGGACGVGSPLAISQLWETFRRAQPRFVERYTAYFYLRSHGWVPRCGLKYGVDFVVYRLGPQQTHAELSLIVETVRRSDLRPTVVAPGSSPLSLHNLTATLGEPSNVRADSWAHLQTLLRMTHGVSKELVFAQVVVPDYLCRCGDDHGGPELPEIAVNSAAPAADGGAASAFWSDPECLLSLPVRLISWRRWTPRLSQQPPPPKCEIGTKTTAGLEDVRNK